MNWQPTREHSDRPFYDHAHRCEIVGRASINRFWKAVRAGGLRNLTGECCVDCGRKALQHDHRDYDRWWDVVPVCRACNIKRGRARPFHDLPRSTGRPINARHLTEHGNQFALSMLEATTEPEPA